MMLQVADGHYELTNWRRVSTFTRALEAHLINSVVGQLDHRVHLLSFATTVVWAIGDRLAQHKLQIPAHASDRIIPPYESRPDAILITPYNAKPSPSSSSSSSSSSHQVLRSTHSTPHRSNTTTRVRQPHRLSVNQRHVYLIQIRSCEDTRLGQQLETTQQQHADICRNIRGKVVLLHTIFMGWWDLLHGAYPSPVKQLGLDHQRAINLARKLHAHSVMYADKLVTSRRAIENNNTPQSQFLELGASSNHPGPH
eukprot:1140225-Pelagomonas_calceolata.AAC.7